MLVLLSPPSVLRGGGLQGGGYMISRFVDWIFCRISTHEPKLSFHVCPGPGRASSEQPDCLRILGGAFLLLFGNDTGPPDAVSSPARTEPPDCLRRARGPDAHGFEPCLPPSPPTPKQGGRGGVDQAGLSCWLAGGFRIFSGMFLTIPSFVSISFRMQARWP